MVLTVPDAGAYEPDIKAIGRHILAAAGVQPPLILQPDWWESQASSWPIATRSSARSCSASSRYSPRCARWTTWLHIFRSISKTPGRAASGSPLGHQGGVAGSAHYGTGGQNYRIQPESGEPGLHRRKTPADAAGSAAPAAPGEGRGHPQYARRGCAGRQAGGVAAEGLRGGHSPPQPRSGPLAGRHPGRQCAVGPAPRVSISLKLSSICPRLDPLDFDNACEVAANARAPSCAPPATNARP